MVNKVILIGNVGADPEVRYLEGGVAVANLRLATTERYKNKNGEKYVKKGMRLYIEGRIRTRSWDDQNGVKRYTTEIYADNMQMLSSRQDGEATGNAPRSYTPSVSSSTSTTATPPMNTPDDNDDLPF